VITARRSSLSIYQKQDESTTQNVLTAFLFLLFGIDKYQFRAILKIPIRQVANV